MYKNHRHEDIFTTGAVDDYLVKFSTASSKNLLHAKTKKSTIKHKKCAIK